MPKGIHTRRMPKSAFGVDLGEYQKGIHTVDFLIWIPDYHCVLSRFGDRSYKEIGVTNPPNAKSAFGVDLAEYQTRIQR